MQKFVLCFLVLLSCSCSKIEKPQSFIELPPPQHKIKRSYKRTLLDPPAFCPTFITNREGLPEAQSNYPYYSQNKKVLVFSTEPVGSCQWISNEMGQEKTRTASGYNRLNLFSPQLVDLQNSNTKVEKNLVLLSLLADELEGLILPASKNAIVVSLSTGPSAKSAENPTQVKQENLTKEKKLLNDKREKRDQFLNSVAEELMANDTFNPSYSFKILQRNNFILHQKNSPVFAVFNRQIFENPIQNDTVQLNFSSTSKALLAFDKIKSGSPVELYLPFKNNDNKVYYLAYNISQKKWADEVLILDPISVLYKIQTYASSDIEKIFLARMLIAAVKDKSISTTTVRAIFSDTMKSLRERFSKIHEFSKYEHELFELTYEVFREIPEYKIFYNNYKKLLPYFQGEESENSALRVALRLASNTYDDIVMDRILELTSNINEQNIYWSSPYSSFEVAESLVTKLGYSNHELFEAADFYIFLYKYLEYSPYKVNSNEELLEISINWWTEQKITQTEKEKIEIYLQLSNPSTFYESEAQISPLFSSFKKYIEEINEMCFKSKIDINDLRLLSTSTLWLCHDMSFANTHHISPRLNDGQLCYKTAKNYLLNHHLTEEKLTLMAQKFEQKITEIYGANEGFPYIEFDKKIVEQIMEEIEKEILDIKNDPLANP